MKPRFPARRLYRALRQELCVQLRLILRVENAVRGGRAAALHDLRVAIRRLRVLLRAFRAPLAATRADELDQRWRDCTLQLSAPRDVDVWLELLHAQPATPPRALRKLEQLQRRQKAALNTRLGSYTYFELKRDTQQLVETEAPAALEAAIRKLTRAAAEAWRNALAQVRKRGQADVARRLTAAHRLRLVCRRARYLAEFFSMVTEDSAAEAKRWRALARRHKAVQDALGALHDSSNLRAGLRQHRAPCPPALAEALNRQQKKSRREFQRAWRKLAAG